MHDDSDQICSCQAQCWDEFCSVVLYLVYCATKRYHLPSQMTCELEQTSMRQQPCLQILLVTSGVQNELPSPWLHLRPVLLLHDHVLLVFIMQQLNVFQLLSSFCTRPRIAMQNKRCGLDYRDIVHPDKIFINPVISAKLNDVRSKLAKSFYFQVL